MHQGQVKRRHVTLACLRFQLVEDSPRLPGVAPKRISLTELRVMIGRLQ